MALIHGAEVARHCSKESCWVVIHGKVWDVTDFMAEHPGGAGVILRCAGRDATEAYDQVHAASLVDETLPPSCCKGELDPETTSCLVTRSAAPSTGSSSQPAQFPPLTSIVSVDDFEKVAQSYLTPAGWAYYCSGADDEYSIADARRLFRKIALRPRILRRVEPVSTAINLLGCPSSLPIYFSPTGQGKYAYREADAESVIAAAAGREGLVYCMPTSAVHDVVFGAKSMPEQRLFFQLYTGRDREKTKALLRKVEALGATAIFLTVDSPVLGKRERDDRIRAAEGDDTILTGGFAKKSSMGLLNPLLSWEDLTWIREATSLPLVIKGVQTVEDAVLAHAHGADGIVLSNHGGRSQDTAQAPILTLLEIRRHAPSLLTSPIKERFQVLLDGGVRRGTDVVKALALGATAVGIGRPVLYSMCAGYGERGLRRLASIFRAEIETNMALAGARNVGELVPEMVNSERAEKEVSRRIKL
ncbi:cytochrome b2 [Stachybotrys elegans]|uniref:Cytochrome b2 n=1 Tax=Stachybotrys elegans TaxID=80388 RepID=A0A8K0WPW8_9HYPO|nr:cytochrome b2 [Stachybotrys elegans]